jgi:hypothetical protein
MLRPNVLAATVGPLHWGRAIHPHRAGEVMKKHKLVCTLNIGDILVQTLVWMLLSFVTLGLALPFFVYYFFKIIINHIEIHEIA